MISNAKSLYDIVFQPWSCTMCRIVSFPIEFLDMLDSYWNPIGSIVELLVETEPPGPEAPRRPCGRVSKAAVDAVPVEDSTLSHMERRASSPAMSSQDEGMSTGSQDDLGYWIPTTLAHDSIGHRLQLGEWTSIIDFRLCLSCDFCPDTYLLFFGLEVDVSFLDENSWEEKEIDDAATM